MIVLFLLYSLDGGLWLYLCTWVFWGIFFLASKKMFGLTVHQPAGVLAAEFWSFLMCLFISICPCQEFLLSFIRLSCNVNFKQRNTKFCLPVDKIPPPHSFEQSTLFSSLCILFLYPLFTVLISSKCCSMLTVILNLLKVLKLIFHFSFNSFMSVCEINGYYWVWLRTHFRRFVVFCNKCCLI
jgi:hypothetical protein